MERTFSRLSAFALAICMSITLAACGGGGSSTPAATTTVTGSVFAAPVAGSSVTVRNTAGSVIAGPVNTAADGSYSVAIPDSALSGAIRIECTGGSFTDEATNFVTAGGHLAAYVEAGSITAGSAIHLTPLSTIAHDLRLAGKTLAESRAVCTTAFGFCDNANVAPRNDNTMTGTDNVARRLAGLRAAAFSQMTRDLGLPAHNQFQLLVAIASDLADNVLNGRNGTDNVDMAPGVPLPEDILNRYCLSFRKVFDNASINHTSLTTADLGNLPLGKVALTASYRIEYIPGTMAASQGKTMFTIKVNALVGGAAVTGAAVRLTPMMHMPTMSHTTPVDNVVIDNGNGTYGCTAYFLMASGTGMGYWELKVTVNGESATFYPPVAMAMGVASNTVSVKLKGQNDNIVAAVPTQRTYYIFRDKLVPTDPTRTFGVFLAANDNSASMPQLQTGTILHDETGTAWGVDNVLVRASTDNGTTWADGTKSSGAHWEFTGLTGLASGTAGHVLVRLFVDGEKKTTDGAAPSGTNAYADFTVTAP